MRETKQGLEITNKCKFTSHCKRLQNLFEDHDQQAFATLRARSHFVTKVKMALRKRVYGDGSVSQYGSSVKKQRRSQALRGRMAKLYRSPYSARFSAGGGYGGELKFFDTAISFTFDATGEVPATGQLALIPQGVTEATRVGRACIVKSIQLRGNIVFAPSTAASAATSVILLLVQDTQCNGAAAAVTDVLTSTNMSTAMINLDNSQRFRILKRMTFTLNSPAGVSTAFNNVVRHFDVYKKCHIPMDYSSTTGAITEIRSNNIFLLAGSDGASDDLVTCGAICRLRFADK